MLVFIKNIYIIFIQLKNQSKYFLLETVHVQKLKSVAFKNYLCVWYWWWGKPL